MEHYLDIEAPVKESSMSSEMNRVGQIGACDGAAEVWTGAANMVVSGLAASFVERTWWERCGESGGKWEEKWQSKLDGN